MIILFIFITLFSCFFVIKILLKFTRSGIWRTVERTKETNPTVIHLWISAWMEYPPFTFLFLSHWVTSPLNIPWPQTHRPLCGDCQKRRRSSTGTNGDAVDSMFRLDLQGGQTTSLALSVCPSSCFVFLCVLPTNGLKKYSKKKDTILLRHPQQRDSFRLFPMRCRFTRWKIGAPTVQPSPSISSVYVKPLYPKWINE